MTSIAPLFKIKRMKNDQAPTPPGEYREVIIIGADGFLGSFICRYLTESGWKVFPTVFSRSPEKNEIRLDVRKPEDFRKLPEKIPLINTAGLPDQSAGISLMREVHIQGMKNLVRWAEKSDCPHIIHTSSVAVYGNATVGTGRSEIATPRRSRNPLTAPLPYGRTKARAEAVLEKSGLPWSGLRFPAIYGPGDSFFTRQLKILLEDSNKPLPPGGKKSVSIMPVDQTGSFME
jgi:nucleoside-diphosphate-sugar epimerase